MIVMMAKLTSYRYIKTIHHLFFEQKNVKFLCCFSLFTDGGNAVTVCGSLSEKVSRARENPSDGAALPGNGSPREALSNGAISGNH